MIKELLELAERFVAATEQIATSLSGIMTIMGNDTCDKAVTEVVTTTTSDTVDYDVLAGQKEEGRKILLGLCEKRGIEVKSRTKNTTLAKMLKAWDVANDTPAGDVEGKDDTPSDEDPFGDGSTGNDDKDPFGDNEEEEVAYTEAQVREALQKLMKSKDNPDEGKKAVIDILDKAAGVKTLKDLPEEEYATVMKEIG